MVLSSMPYFFLYLPVFFAQNLTHRRSSWIVSWNGVGKGRQGEGTPCIGASPLSSKILRTLLVGAKCQRFSTSSLYLSCIFLWLQWIPWQHRSSAAETFMEIQTNWWIKGTKRSPHSLLLPCSISFKEVCLCYHFNSLVNNCAFSLICPLVLEW